MEWQMRKYARSFSRTPTSSLRFQSSILFLHSQQTNCYFLFKKRPNFVMGTNPLSSERASTPPSQERRTAADEPSISQREWQAWGSISLVPSMVIQVIRDLNMLEKETDSRMNFGGNHGKLSGEFKVPEDKKHREKYASLGDSEEKLQFFSARQIACRLLGSRDYLCQKCWLPLEDCMCSRVTTCSLWNRVHIWLYMHPKDFLRQNNTGKLLWQVFGVEAVTLCLFGIAEHEDMMWNEFKLKGRNNAWCLYPSKNSTTLSVKDIVGEDISRNPKIRAIPASNDDTLHFILLDGTWSNSSAMFQRLQDCAALTWGNKLESISLNMGISSMHRLRPQPSWDRTCTAAAAIGLLYELQNIPGFDSFGLDKQAESVEKSLEVLLEALTSRRLRMGRSILRRGRHNNDIC